LSALTATSIDLFNMTGTGSVSVNGSAILITASGGGSTMSMGTLAYSDHSTYSGSGVSSTSAVTLGMNDMTNSFSFASVTLTNTSVTINATFNNASIYGVNYTANDSGSFSSSGPWGSSSGSETSSVVAHMNGFAQVGGSLIGAGSSYLLTGNFSTLSSGSVAATSNGHGNYAIGGTAASYVTSAGLTGTYTALAVGGFAFSNSADFVGVIFSVSNSSSANSHRVEAGSHNGPGLSSTFRSLESHNDLSVGGASGSIFAGTAGSGASILINGGYSSGSFNAYHENGSRSGGVSSTFSRFHSSQVSAAGGFTAKLSASGNSVGLSGNYHSNYSAISIADYHETGSYASGDSFKIDSTDTSFASTSDSGNFSLGGPNASVTGNYTQINHNTHYYHYESAGGSMSSHWHSVDATENSNSKQTLNASYIVTASAASQSGDYDFSQSYSRSETVKNIGMIFAPGLSMHYDDEWTEKSNRSTSDVGTFSPSGASGTATLNALQSTSARRDENGSRSGLSNSTFTSHNHRGGYESQFTENKYGSNPTGKYSNNSNGGSFSQYDENGTRANGDHFSIFIMSNGVRTYNDHGTTTGSGGGLVHEDGIKDVLGRERFERYRQLGRLSSTDAISLDGGDSPPLFLRGVGSRSFKFAVGFRPATPDIHGSPGRRARRGPGGRRPCGTRGRDRHRESCTPYGPGRSASQVGRPRSRRARRLSRRPVHRALRRQPRAR
jgi:hypothetical protein